MSLLNPSQHSFPWRCSLSHPAHTRSDTQECMVLPVRGFICHWRSWVEMLQFKMSCELLSPVQRCPSVSPSACQRCHRGMMHCPSLFTYDYYWSAEQAGINRWTTGEVRLYYSVNTKVIFITKKGRGQKMDGSWMNLTVQSIYIPTNSPALSVNQNIALHSSRCFFAGIINSSGYIKWLCNVGPWQTEFWADDLKLPLHCRFLCAYSDDVAALQLKSTLCPRISCFI